VDKIDAAIAGGQGRFQIFSGVLMAYTASVKQADGSEREVKMLRGIASSTVKDLHGDRMTDNAIAKMEQSAKSNMTIFLNHSYEVPEDVAGSVVSAWSTKDASETAADGNPIALLHFEISVNEQNERAVKAWSAIQGGTKLGLSIGAMIPDGGATWDKQAGGYIIDDIELLETSIVGIPANPKSWVEYAVKSLGGRPATAKAAVPLDAGKPQVTLDADTGAYEIRGQLGDIAVVRGVSPASEAKEPEVLPVAAAPETAGETVEPDTQDSSITVIQIDTGNDSGSSGGDDSDSAGSSSSDPETGASGTTDSAGTDAGLTRAYELLGSSAAVIRSTNELILALSTELETTRSQLAAETTRADEAEAAAQTALTAAADTLTRVKNLPLGRKAVLTEVEDSFHRSMSEVYSSGALKVLTDAEAKAKAATTK
jgi:hypothetical protein